MSSDITKEADLPTARFAPLNLELPAET